MELFLSEPTATHTVLDGQATPYSPFTVAPLGFGVDCSFQVGHHGLAGTPAQGLGIVGVSLCVASLRGVVRVKTASGRG